MNSSRNVSKFDLILKKYLKMSDTKLSSDEVPERFASWLLTMGCPPDKVPPLDKISQYVLIIQFY